MSHFSEKIIEIISSLKSVNMNIIGIVDSSNNKYIESVNSSKSFLLLLSFDAALKYTCQILEFKNIPGKYDKLNKNPKIPAAFG